MQMFGQVNSLNVSVATGIVLYEVVRKRKNWVKILKI
jgi:tRNA G18 (ribose-2'-O)-methylase SpoU